MKQHALQTAMTLYEGGTLDLETAASQAGISPARLRRASQRFGVTPAPKTDSERISVHAD